MGLVLIKGGDTRGAVSKYIDAVALAPDWAAPHNNLAAALCALDDVTGALEHAKRAVALVPEWAAARNSLGMAHLTLTLTLTLPLPLRNNLGMAYAANRERIEAMSEFERAVSLRTEGQLRTTICYTTLCYTML